MSRLPIVLLLLFAQLAVALAEVPLADFARHDSFDDPSISPDGHYVALTIPLGKGRGVAIFDLRQSKLILKQTLGEDRSANGYLWASDERLVVSLAENFGELEAPFATGEMIAFNVDGSQQQYLFGFRGILPFNSTYVERLKAPVLIIHGEEDLRVPFSQAMALRKALKKADHPYEWLAVEGEGPGFFKPENRTLLLTGLVAFLDRTPAPAS